MGKIIEDIKSGAKGIRGVGEVIRGEAMGATDRAFQSTPSHPADQDAQFKHKAVADKGRQDVRGLDNMIARHEWSRKGAVPAEQAGLGDANTYGGANSYGGAPGVPPAHTHTTPSHVQPVPGSHHTTGIQGENLGQPGLQGQHLGQQSGQLPGQHPSGQQYPGHENLGQQSLGQQRLGQHTEYNPGQHLGQQHAGQRYPEQHLGSHAGHAGHSDLGRPDGVYESSSTVNPGDNAHHLGSGALGSSHPTEASRPLEPTHFSSTGGHSHDTPRQYEPSNYATGQPTGNLELGASQHPGSAYPGTGQPSETTQQHPGGYHPHDLGRPAENTLHGNQPPPYEPETGTQAPPQPRYV